MPAMTEDTIFGLPRWRFCLLLLALFGALCLNITYIHAGVQTLKEMPDWHLAHMTNHATAPLQYRWLSYIIPDLISRTGVPIGAAYLIMRFVYLAVAIHVIGLVAAKLDDARRGYFPLVVASVFIAYYGASIQNHIQPAEEPNIAIFAIGIHLLLSGRSLWWWPPLVLVGALTKDTIGFLIPYLFLYGWMSGRNRAQLLVVCAIVSIEFVAVYLGLRHYFGEDRPYLGGMWQGTYNYYFMIFNPVQGLMWTIPSLLPLWIVIREWRATPWAVRLFCPSLILFCIGHLMISRVDEFRTYAVLGIVTFPYMLSLLLPRATSEMAQQQLDEI